MLKREKPRCCDGGKTMVMVASQLDKRRRIRKEKEEEKREGVGEKE